jgi:hypothetical protein
MNVWKRKWTCLEVRREEGKLEGGGRHFKIGNWNWKDEWKRN